MIKDDVNRSPSQPVGVPICLFLELTILILVILLLSCFLFYFINYALINITIG